jgi:NAD(P)H-hydrate epimerase
MKKPPPKKLNLTPQQCRQVDQYAIEQLGVAGLVLMENAGRNAADRIERWYRRLPEGKTPQSKRVSVVCGKGNNGGDGFVIARHLLIRGFDVSIDLAAEAADLRGDAATNHAIARELKIPVRSLLMPKSLADAQNRWKECDVLIDALMGTGFSGALRDPIASIVEAFNNVDGSLKVAVDVPSGLDAERGEVEGLAIQADRTITFVASKIGFKKKVARPYVGRVTVCDIGVPTSLILERLAEPIPTE